MILRPGYQREVLEQYALGCTDSEICAMLQIAMRQFNKHYDNDDTFKEVVDYGRTLSKAFWDKLGRTKVDDKNFNTALYVAWRKNYHGWADKVQNETRISELNLSSDEVDAELASLAHVLEEHRKVAQPTASIKGYMNGS